MSCTCRYHRSFSPVPQPLRSLCRPSHAYYETPHYYSCCSVCCRPYHLCCCDVKSSAMLPEEIAADSTNTSAEALIGGLSDVRLTLEYMADEGKTSTATVVITITGSEETTTLEIKNIAAGYHIKDDFAAVKPGSKVKLEVNDCSARLRWCEVISC